MNRRAICCGAETNVGSAVQLRWENNCGLLPVVGGDGELIGAVIGREVCTARGTRSRVAGELPIGEIATEKVFACKAEDEIHKALQIMTNGHVRPLRDKAFLYEFFWENQLLRCLKNSTWRKRLFAALRVLYGPPRFLPLLETT